MEPGERAGRVRAPHRPPVAARSAGTLAFRVPAQEACRVRQALSAAPTCSIRACVPDPCAKAVALWIEFEPGTQHALMDLLMACVPSGRFGRVLTAGTTVH